MIKVNKLVKAQHTLKSWVSRNVGSWSKAKVAGQFPKVTQHVQLLCLQAKVALKVDNFNLLVCFCIQVKDARVVTAFKITVQLSLEEFFVAHSNQHLEIFKLSLSATIVCQLNFV